MIEGIADGIEVDWERPNWGDELLVQEEVESTEFSMVDLTAEELNEASRMTLETEGSSKMERTSCSSSTFTANKGGCGVSGQPEPPLLWWACARLSAAIKALETGGQELGGLLEEGSRSRATEKHNSRALHWRGCGEFELEEAHARRKMLEGEERRDAATWRGVVCPWRRLAASSMERERTEAASGVNVC